MHPLHLIVLFTPLIWAFNTDHDLEPNIVLVVADDVGYGDFNCYGHPTQEFGGVDKMAAEGLKFTQAYTPAVVCSPSRAAMLTGIMSILIWKLSFQLVIFELLHNIALSGIFNICMFTIHLYYTGNGIVVFFLICKNL